MKTKSISLCILILICMLSLAGCSSAETDKDGGFIRKTYTGIIEGNIADESGGYIRIDAGEYGAIDFLITDSSEIDGDKNITDGDYVNVDCVYWYDTETYELLKLAKSDEVVKFRGQLIDASLLSEETLEWLDWFNSLPEDEQLSISAVPADLLDAGGISGNEDEAASVD